MLQEALGPGELAAAKKLSENEARVTELTDKWKDRWRETQKILEVNMPDFLTSYWLIVLIIIYFVISTS